MSHYLNVKTFICNYPHESSDKFTIACSQLEAGTLRQVETKLTEK